MSNVNVACLSDYIGHSANLIAQRVLSPTIPLSTSFYIIRERYSFLLFNQMINISRIPSIQRHLRINGPKVMSLAEEWVINRSLDKCNCSRNKQRLECESAVEKSHCASVRGHLPFSETDYCI